MDDRSTVRHILIAHDFGETAEQALAFGLGLAEKLGARVTLVHVYELPTFGFPDGPAMSAQMAGQIERAARTALDAVAMRVGGPEKGVVGVLRQGAAWSEIVALAGELKADLIVMGTHGRRGLSRMLLGSVAEKVVRSAPCPVLTVHGPPHAA
jgi:nucleotide-binding universal stress UspA family protein